MRVVPSATEKLLIADEPLVKSAEKEAVSRPVSAGHVVSVGLQSVKVCAKAEGRAAKATAAAVEKRMANATLSSCDGIVESGCTNGDQERECVVCKKTNECRRASVRQGANKYRFMKTEMR